MTLKKAPKGLICSNNSLTIMQLTIITISFQVAGKPDNSFAYSLFPSKAPTLKDTDITLQ